MSNHRWMSLNFFVFFFTWGIFLPYWTGWLADGKGLSIPEASIIMGAGLFIRSASTLFLYPFISKYWSQKTVFWFFTLSSFFLALLYIVSSTFVALLVVTVLFSVFYPTLLATVESMGGTLVQNGSINYGKSRSYGSLGYIFSIFAISILSGYYGNMAILYSMIGGIVLLFLIGFLPTPEVLLSKPSKEERKNSLSMASLMSEKSFVIVLLIVILIHGSHASVYNYGYIYVQDLGANSYMIGLILNIAVICEIIYFAVADRLFRNWKTSSLLILAAIGSTLRWVLIFLFPNVWVFMFSQTLHALSFGVTHFAFTGYITEKLPPQQIPNAQGLYVSLAMSFSTAILTFATGFLYEMSPGLAFIAMLVCTIPAILIILSTKKAYRY